MSDIAPLRPRAFLLFAAVYLYAFPYFGDLKSAEELSRVLLTQEIVNRGSFYLDHRVPEMASTMDLSQGLDFHFFSNRAPGVSFVAVPGYWLCKAVGTTSLRACTWVFRITTVVFPTLLFLWLFYRLADRFSQHEPARRTALVAYALGSPALVYGLLFTSHQLAAVCAGGAFAAAVTLARNHPQRPRLMATGMGFLAAMAVLVEYQAAIATALVILYAVARARPRGRNALFMTIGALPPLTALGLYHAVAFGAPWRTGFNTAVDPVLKEAYMGIVGPSWQSFSTILFRPSSGMLWLLPWILVALVGALAIARDPAARTRVGAETLLCAAIFVAYVVFLTCLDPTLVRGGWSMGPRFMTVTLPFLGWLAAAGFAVTERRLWSRVLALGSVVVALAINVVTATTYPYWPDELKNPLYELAFRLLGQGHTVHSLGTWVGLRGFWAALPLYLLAVAVLIGFTGRHRPKPVLSLALAVLLASAAIASYGAFPRSGAYADRVWTFVMTTWEPKF
jgi:hypothetical protein